MNRVLFILLFLSSVHAATGQLNHTELMYQFSTEIDEDVLATYNKFKKTVYKPTGSSGAGMTVSCVNDSVFHVIIYADDKPFDTSHHVVAGNKIIELNKTGFKRVPIIHQPGINAGTTLYDTTWRKLYGHDSTMRVTIQEFDSNSRMASFTVFENDYHQGTKYEYHGDTLRITRHYEFNNNDSTLLRIQRDYTGHYNKNGFRADTSTTLVFGKDLAVTEKYALITTYQKRFDRNSFLKEIILNGMEEKNGHINSYIEHLYIRRYKK
ncbi:MAG TPA: hypothetical protein VK177_01035 [Flavobacteriales bacterium]|nr:hypothetical protein [Flavobacteriales bacterium]